MSKNKNINTNHKRSVVRKLQKYSSTDCNDILGKTITNESYDQFIKKFSLIYDDCFSIKVKEIKTKNLLSPWVTKGIKKSSKIKHKLYEKVLKKKSLKNEKEYKDYKQLFEKIKKDFKKKYFQEKFTCLILQHYLMTRPHRTRARGSSCFFKTK